MPRMAFATLARRPLALTSLPFLFAASAVFVAGVARDAHAQTPEGSAAPGATPPPLAPAPTSPPATAPVSAPPPATATPTPATASIDVSAQAATPTAPVVPSYTPTPIEAVAPTAEEEEWRARDRDLLETATLTGGVGLLHLQHAQGGAPGQVRLGFTAEYFSAGFLCTETFSCADPLKGPTRLTSDSLDHIGGTLDASVTLTKFLEAYASTWAYANSDSANRPSLLQVLGDTDLGLKAYGRLGRWFHVGGAAELWLVNGTGSVGLDGSGTSGKFRLITTGDLRELAKPVPLRFTLNGTYSLDNSGDVIADTETRRGGPITRIERFGLGINRLDHVDVGVGLEAFAAHERVRPFVEYNMLIPVNRQNYTCHQPNANNDNCLANAPVIPSKLTVGARFLPWKGQGFGITLAGDIGLTGVKSFIEELAPQAPWTVYLGASWSIDTKERPPVIQTKIVEKAAPVAPRAHVKGFVHERDKPDAVANAIVSFDGHPEITSLATGPDGRFTTSELAEGTWTFTVRADGYRDGQCMATLTRGAPAAGAAASNPANPAEPPPPAAPAPGTEGLADVSVDCPLEALPRVGRVVGHVRDADTTAPIATATIKMVDAAGKDLTLTSDSTGAYRFDGVSPGAATMTVDADGYMTQVQPVDVKPRVDNAVDVPMKHRPKNPLVNVTAKEITIKQQIQFATDSAVILPESNALLTEIADVLMRNPRIKKVEIQGHTDSEGPDDHNQVLSEDRANSVKTWLTSHGVAADRLVAKGYGEKKPLVPNVTPQNRARNRRVQFIILEQDPATPAEKGAGAAGGGKGTKP